MVAAAAGKESDHRAPGDLIQEEVAGARDGWFSCALPVRPQPRGGGAAAHLTLVPFAAPLEGWRDTEERLSRVGGPDADPGLACQLAPGPSSHSGCGFPAGLSPCWVGVSGMPGRAADGSLGSVHQILTAAHSGRGGSVRGSSVFAVHRDLKRKDRGQAS